MPELPDVEIARRRLKKTLVGATIRRAHSDDRRVLRPGSPRAFGRALVGRTVRDVGRRGKWLRIVLDDGSRLFSHLGMSGWWVAVEIDSPRRPSERARIDVARKNGRAASIRYLDGRRFGRLIVARDDIEEWGALGPDPFLDGIDRTRLAKSFARRRTAVKSLLMDQEVLAGIGNILATEALWRARIDPRSPSSSLSRSEVGALARAIEATIRQELVARGSADEDAWEDAFSVYGRAGAPCPRCGTTIQRTIVGGRTTAFCRRCQTLSTGARRS
jgi:formamidopyrimidine-DNA glycosylase